MPDTPPISFPHLTTQSIVNAVIAVLAALGANAMSNSGQAPVVIQNPPVVTQPSEPTRPQAARQPDLVIEFRGLPQGTVTVTTPDAQPTPTPNVPMVTPVPARPQGLLSTPRINVVELSTPPTSPEAQAEIDRYLQQAEKRQPAIFARQRREWAKDARGKGK